MWNQLPNSVSWTICSLNAWNSVFQFQCIANSCNYCLSKLPTYFFISRQICFVGSIHPSIHPTMYCSTSSNITCMSAHSQTPRCKCWLSTVGAGTWRQFQIDISSRSPQPRSETRDTRRAFCSTICVKILTGHCYFRGLWIGYNLGTILDLHHLFQWKS